MTKYTCIFVTSGRYTLPTIFWAKYDVQCWQTGLQGNPGCSNNWPFRQVQSPRSIMFAAVGQYRDQGSTWCKVLRSSVVSWGHMVRRSRGVISNLNTCGQGVRSQSAGQGEKSVGFERQLLTVFVVNILRFERNGGKFLKRHFQMYFVGRNYWTLNWIRLKCVYVSLQ